MAGFAFPRAARASVEIQLRVRFAAVTRAGKLFEHERRMEQYAAMKAVLDHRIRRASRCTVSAKYGRDCSQKDLEVKPEAPIANVRKVQGNPFIK